MYYFLQGLIGIRNSAGNQVGAEDLATGRLQRGLEPVPPHRRRRLVRVQPRKLVAVAGERLCRDRAPGGSLHPGHVRLPPGRHLVSAGIGGNLLSRVA